MGHDAVLFACIRKPTVKQDAFVGVLIAGLLKIQTGAGAFSIGYGAVDCYIQHHKNTGAVFLKQLLTQVLYLFFLDTGDLSLCVV